MAKSGPIILIDDDHDDKDLFLFVINKLEIQNEFLYFDNCVNALGFLQTTTKQPCIIFCDINLPRMTGLEFKKIIDADKELRKKSIPFIFYSTSVDQKSVDEAYLEMTIQGFFEKGSSIEIIRRDIERILDYWLRCRHPNS
jgi:CheY-like chemotaxis protein